MSLKTQYSKCNLFVLILTWIHRVNPKVLHIFPLAISSLWTSWKLVFLIAIVSSHHMHQLQLLEFTIIRCNLFISCGMPCVIPREIKLVQYVQLALLLCLENYCGYMTIIKRTISTWIKKCYLFKCNLFVLILTCKHRVNQQVLHVFPLGISSQLTSWKLVFLIAKASSHCMHQLQLLGFKSLGVTFLSPVELSVLYPEIQNLCNMCSCHPYRASNNSVHIWQLLREWCNLFTHYVQIYIVHSYVMYTLICLS